MARATSVGIATAQAFDPVLSPTKISAGTIIPASAQSPGSTTSFGRWRPSRISRPISTKNMKVRTFESMVNRTPCLLQKGWLNDCDFS